jgi:ATP-dependent DNA helicase RecG
VTSAPGVGPALAKKLQACGITTLFDVVWELPVAYEDWTVTGSLDDALGLPAASCVLEVKVRNKRWSFFGGRRTLLASFDEVTTGKRLDGKWMFAAHGLEARLVAGETLLLRGKLRTAATRAPSVINPELRPLGQGTEPRYEPSIDRARFRKLVAWSLAHADLDLCDPLPDSLRANPFNLQSALCDAHEGPVPVDVHSELAKRRSFVSACARVVDFASERRQGALLVRQVDCQLNASVTPTPDQVRALGEVATDLRSGNAMRRIVTGDVGTGKTWVALAAAHAVLQAGGQVAYLCPTGLLAAQVTEAARALGVFEPLVLTGSTPKAAPHRARIASGEAAFVIGTHALLGLQFARLGLVIIDEHHRLGVLQRLALLGKGKSVHLLSLTATPIPRTLARLLSAHPNDVATSVLTKRPFDRPLSAVTIAHESAWVDWLERLQRERTFIVCPRIDQGPGSAEARLAWLGAHAPSLRTGLIHGAMGEREQRKVLDRFQGGDVSTLVATTVVEVGLDVPDATLMLIDQADRFGLAQLHQLRGRVGRGSVPGHAVLFHRAGADASRVAQLQKFAAATSGLEVAQLDLAMRGPGTRGGVEQSGFVNAVYYGDPSVDQAIEDAAAVQVALGLDGVLAQAVERELERVLLEQGA